CNNVNPKDLPIWLPYAITASKRDQACIPRLPTIEIQPWEVQCCDSLDFIQHRLCLKTQMLQFKYMNISSQQDSIRSCININNIHEQAVQGAERHCVGRKVLLMLWGPGDWENKLQDLKDSVVWAYMDLVKGTWK
ncbi:hypothetical protein V5O48_010492, partial [Marasmius crinis-equi]